MFYTVDFLAIELKTGTMLISVIGVRKSDIDPICMYCAEHHGSKMCPHKKNAELRKCSNCASSRIATTRSGAHTHNAAD